jgi:hypothetical protein
MSAKIKALREQIEADPAARQWWSDIGEKLNLLGLKAGTWHDGLFPPASPTSKRRGRTAFTPGFMDAVCAVLDTGTAGSIGEDFQAGIVTACKNADADFFLMMADAVKHVQSMPATLSVHARHVIALRKAAIKMMEMGIEPTKSELKKIVTKYLGNAAFKNDQAWIEAFKDAGLGHLRARPPAKKAAKVRGKTH